MSAASLFRRTFQTSLRQNFPARICQNQFQSRLFHNSPAKMGVHQVKSKEEFNKIIELKTVDGGALTATDAEGTVTKEAVLVDFFATWCGPCRAIAPTLEKWSNDPKYRKIQFVKVDVDELPDVSQEAGIQAMPTFMVFENGEKKDFLLGANPPKLEKLVNDVVERHA